MPSTKTSTLADKSYNLSASFRASIKIMRIEKRWLRILLTTAKAETPIPIRKFGTSSATIIATLSIMAKQKKKFIQR